MAQVGSTAQVAAPPAGLSLDERDRRWQLVRDLMRANDIEVLIVGGFRSRDHYEHFVSNDYIEGAVVFPLSGEPVALSWADTRLHRAEESFSRGVHRWIGDYRTGVNGQAVAGLVSDLSPAGGIGIVGLDTQTAGEFSGFVPARFWIDLTAALPGREVRDVSWQFNELMLAKSEEELELVRWAAEVAESASHVMLEVVEPGVPETEIYAAVMSEIYMRGCNVRYPTLILHSGYPSLAWGPPRWTTTAEPVRRIGERDLVQAEIFPTYGNAEVQVQMSVAVGKPEPLVANCADIARASYEAGLEVLRAGLTFGELVSAMEKPLRDTGAWALTPLVHTVNPQSFIGITRINRDAAPSVPALAGPRPAGKLPVAGDGLVMPAGTTLAFEPNACFDRTRVNIGGTIVVTENGFEEINSLACRMQVK